MIIGSLQVKKGQYSRDRGYFMKRGKIIYLIIPVISGVLSVLLSRDIPTLGEKLIYAVIIGVIIGILAGFLPFNKQ